MYSIGNRTCTASLLAHAELLLSSGCYVTLLQAATDAGRKALWKVSAPELLRKA
jgi:hypothetical protein